MFDIVKPKVFLVMPNHGMMHPDVARTWYDPAWPSSRRTLDLVESLEMRQSSIVGSFNTLWGVALDKRDKGEATHFAMQHNDVEPPAWWLDDLYGVMRVRNVACVSANIGIKHHERTEVSAGVANRADKFDRRRFSFDDLAKLPVTFGNSHVSIGEYVLPNTGLMLIDMRSPAWDDFVFTQDGEFGRTPDGSREFKFQPEDWEMGRYMTERNIPYVCTSIIHVRHHGPDTWDNFAPGSRPEPWKAKPCPTTP